MDKLTKGGPAPDKGHRGSGPSGSHQTPEGAKANFTGSRRGQYPKGSEPRPGQRVKPGKSGSSQSWGNLKPNRVAPIATREGKGSGKPAGSTKSAFKRSGGSDRSKL